MALSIADRIQIAVTLAPAVPASGVSPPPIPIGMVVAAKPPKRNAPGSFFEYARPSSGFTNDVPSAAMPGAPLLTNPRRISGASSGVIL